MRWNSLGSIALVLGMTACGAATPPAEAPEEESASKSKDSHEGEPGLDEPSSAISRAKDPMVPVTVKDETEGKKKDAPCAGTNIPDLVAIASQASCEVNDPQAEVARRDVKDALEIKVATDPPKVAPGATAKVTLSLHNKGKTPLQLDFAIDPEPRFKFEVYTKKGQRVDKPAGDEPRLPPEIANAPVPERQISRVLLAPQGNATVALSWDAIKYKWVAKEKAKGAVPGRGFPREPAGPSPAGKYVLRIVMPLVGLAEGVDHEVTQPRTEIEIGN
jgi:hypothetical protein